MRVVKLVIGFIGTRYEGWQSQRNGHTLQEVFEKVLRKLFGRPTPIVGSSRTDSGVHARGFTAHFKTESRLSDREIKKALNFYLPRDVVVLTVRTVRATFHARFDAKSKSYRYDIWNAPTRPVFEAPFVLFYPYRLNVGSMRKAARYLIGRHDFRAFANMDGTEKDTVRTLRRLRISKKKDLVSVGVEADGFLKQMVRIIVGTLLEVGRGKMEPERVKEILASHRRSLAGPTAKPQGLTLVRVRY